MAQPFLPSRTAVAAFSGRGFDMLRVVTPPLLTRSLPNHTQVLFETFFLCIYNFLERYCPFSTNVTFLVHRAHPGGPPPLHRHHCVWLLLHCPYTLPILHPYLPPLLTPPWLLLPPPPAPCPPTSCQAPLPGALLSLSLPSPSTNTCSVSLRLHWWPPVSVPVPPPSSCSPFPGPCPAPWIRGGNSPVHSQDLLVKYYTEKVCLVSRYGSTYLLSR